MKIEHGIVSLSETRYRSFPDIVKDGERLLCVFRDADAHIASESRLLASYSCDGLNWSEASVLDPEMGHMPRASCLADGGIIIIDDGAPPHFSQHGYPRILCKSHGSEDFTISEISPGDARMIPYCPSFAPDRILTVDSETYLCLGQVRMGIDSRRHTFAIFLYRSDDSGVNWYPSVMTACLPDVRLCEPSMCRLSDGRLFCMYRNNEPNGFTKFHLSADNGESWSQLSDAPFYGMRPTVGELSDGRLLVTYRKVNKPFGTAAWCGTLDELIRGDISREFMIMPLAKRISLGDMGYTGWIESERGVVNVVFHHSDEPNRSYIRACRIVL